MVYKEEIDEGQSKQELRKHMEWHKERIKKIMS